MSPEALYQVEGDGNIKCAIVSTEDELAFEYSVSLSILSGDCNAKTKCEGYTFNRQEIGWAVNVGTSYFLVVKGVGGGKGFHN